MQWLNYWEEESRFVFVSCMHLIELKQQKLTDNIPQPIFVVTYWCTLNLNILVDAPSFFSVLIARLSVAFWLIWGSISHFFEICVCQNIASTSVYVKKQNKTRFTDTHLLTSTETISSHSARYCPTCKNDTSEVVKAGEKLKASKKKAKMPSATTESQRDWGKVRPEGTQRYTQTRWTARCSVRLESTF